MATSPERAGAVAGGVISIIVNGGTFLFKRWVRKGDEKQDWINEVKTTLQNLKTETFRLESGLDLSFDSQGIIFDSSSDSLNRIGGLIDELEELNNNMPQENIDSGVNYRIEELVSRIRNPEGGRTQLDTTTDLSEFVYEKCIEIEDEIE